MALRDYSRKNKAAWEYSAYDFRRRQCAPAERARLDLDDPKGQLKRYAAYFDAYEGVKVASICGSCGKKAIPLALLGCEVTVFDISEENRRYAMEVARLAHAELDYQVCDVLDIDRARYGLRFDVVFMEGGVLHYFHRIDEFMRVMNALLKPGGTLICSDFHPFTKIVDALGLEQQTGSYFSTDVFEGEMVHARFFEDEIRRRMPRCGYRKYTLSEILNAVIDNGFAVKRFDEHPSWADPRLPGEFTLVGIKQAPAPETRPQK